MSRFPFSYRANVEDRPLTLSDLEMQELSYAIRSKPSWWTKYKVPEIRAKWKEEILTRDIPEDDKITELEVDYLLDELSGYENMRDEATGIQQSCCFRTYESDTLVSEDLRQRLIAGVAKLEDVPDEEKDWHPRSNGMVLDLVHPSLYCLVYGRTIGYPDPVDNNAPRTAGNLRVFEPPPVPDGDIGGTDRPYFEEDTLSKRFAWIPTDFDIAQDGTRADGHMYINNLHPSHKDLYATIEALVARFSFLFDRVLTDLHPENDYPVRITDTYSYEEDDRDEPPSDYEGSDSDADSDDRLKSWQRSRKIILPTVPSEGYTEDISQRKAKCSIQGRQVQCIIKLANIHLTPDKPEYEGGSWHVEGMANELIAASGIYYYDSENITDSHLAFRTVVTSDRLQYQQDDDSGVYRTYGLDREMEGNQMLGAVKTSRGRCIAFPNVYQHRVSSFKLVDPTKPGHRKIFALFLVHPRHRIPSTSDIMPQQAPNSWATIAMQSAPPGSLLHKIPPELRKMIVENMEGVMTEREAKKYREALMDERTKFVGSQEGSFGGSFNMCEH